ncbi:MAG: UbiA family prenyltransferase [Planctomycetota bacterium]|jgi:1,4-dihydroxy-2-naphthoate octaprenyltransferase
MSTKLKIWFLETRPQFLLLSVVLVLLGTAMSFHHGHFHWPRFVLTTLGLVLAHASVNILNDYFDYKSGIDIATTRTPFSGGSGLLPAGLLEPKSVYKFGLGCLFAALLIGIYLTAVSGWQVLPLIVVGGVVIYFYTSYLTKWLAGEIWAGLGLGTLPILGTYFVQTGSYSSEALVASLAPGFLTANLLLLNEFPDLAADREAGRYHIVIALGKVGAGRLYAGLMAMTYLCIIVGVVCKIMPPLTLIALLTIPFAVKAIGTTFKHHDDLQKMIPALGANVITVLATNALLALGYLLTRLI